MPSQKTYFNGLPPEVIFEVRMVGVPYRATEEEMMDFFSPEVKCVGAFHIREDSNLPSGEAIAEFESEEEAQLAIKYKHRAFLRDRYILLYMED